MNIDRRDQIARLMGWWLKSELNHHDGTVTDIWFTSPTTFVTRVDWLNPPTWRDVGFMMEWAKSNGAFPELIVEMDDDGVARWRCKIWREFKMPKGVRRESFIGYSYNNPGYAVADVIIAMSDIGEGNER